MKRIGLLSDTHSYNDPKYYEYFKDCDEIWHAGDIGSNDLADKFEHFKPIRFVIGNIDGNDLKKRFPAILKFNIEGVNVLMTHIGGYPGKYEPTIEKEIMKNQPQLFISGHSHILKVKYDRRYGLLHINPGAAGKQGFHTVRTLIRFVVDNGNIKDLEVIELAKD